MIIYDLNKVGEVCEVFVTKRINENAVGKE